MPGLVFYSLRKSEQLPLLLPILREIIYCLCQRHFRRRFALHDGDYYIRGQIDQRQGSGNVGAIQFQRFRQFQNGTVPADSSICAYWCANSAGLRLDCRKGKQWKFSGGYL